SGPVKPAGTAAPAAAAIPQPTTPSAMIKDVRFERASPTAGGCAPNGCDRVVVDLGGIPAYSLSISASGKPRLELRSTALPESFARTLDVSAFGGALKTITASRDEKAGTAILELDRT